MLYRSLVRPLLFKSDPEKIHEAGLNFLEFIQNSILRNLLAKAFAHTDERLENELFGLRFGNPVGLAAGFDKNGRLLKIIPALGFGFLEVGTVTGRPQSGNPRPRLFRLPEDKALINRFGFNSEGALAVSRRLAKAGKPEIPLGVNLGKTERVSVTDAVDDYLFSFETLYPFGEYFAVNVSCPNTPELQCLQEREPLKNLLGALIRKNEQLADKSGRDRKPILVKICPDLNPPQIDDIIRVVEDLHVDGIIAANTTVSRHGLREKTAHEEWGGVSGRPLTKMSTETIVSLYRRVGRKIPIIGVGGIFNAEDAYEKIKAGASLVQVYTGMIYEGPGVIKNINKGLIKLIERDGHSSVREAIGALLH